MARLPDSLPQASVDGPGLPIAAAPATDFGLGAAGAIAQNVAIQDRRAAIYEQRVQDKADQDAVRPDVLKLAGANEDQLAADAPKWNGQPGFAADQISQYTARAQAAAANPAYTPGQRAAFRKLSDQAVQETGAKAFGTEAAVIRQNAVDQTEVQQNGVVAAQQADFAPAKQALLDSYDGSQLNLVPATLAAFDQSAQTALAAAPDNLKPGLQAQFSRMRQQEQNEALAQQAKGHDAFVLGNAEIQGHTAIDTVTSNPSSYDSVVANVLPGIIASIPAQHRQEASQVLYGEAAQAKIRGLIGKGQPAAALAEAQSDKYDAYLTPDQKETLQSEALAASRANAPVSDDQALAQDQMRQHIQLEQQALLSTGKSTGLVSDAQIRAALPMDEAAKALFGIQQARTAFAVAGPVREWTNAQLQQAAAAPADPAEGEIGMLRRAAAQAELAQRQKPGEWAFNSNGKGLPAGVTGPAQAAAAISQDRGAALTALWQQTIQGVPHAGGTFAGTMLETQRKKGIPVSAWQMVPDTEAARLAAGVQNASPDQRAAAMQSLGNLFGQLPASARLSDGTTANPRAILARQLIAAKLDPRQLAAVTQFAGNPAALGMASAAFNDPKAGAALKEKDETALRTAVNQVLVPYFASNAPMPGWQLQAQGQQDLAMSIGRHLVLTQNMAPAQAAAAATQGLMDGVKQSGTWRMPAAMADQVVQFQGGRVSGQQIAQQGMNQMKFKLTGDPKAYLYTPPGEVAGEYAAKINAHGQWFTNQAGDGVMLMVPHGDGNWDVVSDNGGHPVQANWDQLKVQATGKGPIPFATSPPQALKTPDGTPAPAMSKQQAFEAGVFGITRQESRFRDGLISDQGAMGRMQITPETAAPIAQKLFGQPLDKNRLLNDGTYNSAIGRQHFADLVNHFGADPRGFTLAVASYFDGQGNVEGYTDAAGFHPGLLQKIGDPRDIGPQAWVEKMAPYAPKTQAYVDTVMKAAALHALGRL